MKLTLCLLFGILVHIKDVQSASFNNVLALLEPIKDDFSNLPAMTNKVKTKVYDIVPQLRQMRAQTAATEGDFVKAVVGTLSSAVLGKSIFADSAIYLINWFLSSLSSLIPLEVVEYFLGRSLVMSDVQMVEVFVRDCIEVYEAWTTIGT